jgi:hypothetical protein
MGNRELIITEAEKRESIRKGTADLKAWRERNPDAPRGLPVRK